MEKAVLVLVLVTAADVHGAPLVVMELLLLK
jgi:hypothetical protein